MRTERRIIVRRGDACARAVLARQGTAVDAGRQASAAFASLSRAGSLPVDRCAIDTIGDVAAHSAADVATELRSESRLSSPTHVPPTIGSTS
jgi:hypothetical protein